MIETLTKTIQLKELILDDIRRGVYKQDGSFPSIRKLCKKYGVCKQTVSQSLIALKEMGIVNVSHGKSTTLSEKAERENIEILQVGNFSPATSEFFSELLDGILEVLGGYSGYSYNIRRLPTDGTMGNFPEEINLFHTKGILLLCSNDPAKIRFLRRLGIPFLVVYQKVFDSSALFVSINLDCAVRGIVEAFIHSGHRKLAFIGTTMPERGVDFEKLELFRKYAAAAGFPLDEKHVRECGYEPEKAYREMKSLLSEGKSARPDAVFLATDPLCAAAYRAIFDEGLSIPKDIAVAGCDNLSQSAYMTPSLTTIDIPRREIGRRAAEEIVRIIENGKSAGKNVTLKAKLLRRESI